MISLGKKGVAYTQKLWDYALVSLPPRIKPINTAGSGDCLLACFAETLELGGNVDDALRLGTAAGAANALTMGPGADLDPSVVQEFSKKVGLKKVKF